MNTQDFYEKGSENRYPKFLFFKYVDFTEFIKNSDKKELSEILNDNIPFIDEDLKYSIEKIEPKSISDLSVALALSSPFKKGILKKIKYHKLRPELRELKCDEIKNILKNSFYFIVFKQQVLKLIQMFWKCDENAAKKIKKEIDIKSSNYLDLLKRDQFGRKIVHTLLEKSVKTDLEKDAINIAVQISDYSPFSFDQKVATEYANKVYDISKLLLEKTEEFCISNKNTEFIKNLVNNINNRDCYD